MTLKNMIKSTIGDRKSNYQDAIKLYAIILMIIDHIGLYIFPEIQFLRVLGRGAMPIFCFFAGYNFYGKIDFKILLFGIVTYSISAYFIWGKFITTNILISILIGQIYLKIFEHHMSNFWSAYIHVVLTSSISIFTADYIDYGTMVISIMILGCLARRNPKEHRLSALLSFCIALVHSIFGFPFTGSELFFTILVYASGYIMISRLPLFAQVAFNISFITRNSLLVYSVHFIAIELAWVYFILNK